MLARRTLAALAALALAAGTAAGCGGDSENDAGVPSTRQDNDQPTPTPEATSESDGGAGLEDTSTKPVIPKPSGQPPSKLQIQDIVTGKGPKAKAGDTVSMQYVGVSFSTGEEFDASWDRGEPFQFQLGAGMVIQGWDEGIVGMRQGGRRKLTIPPDLAYGAQGAPPSIGPNETLVFVVDLQQIG